jgi:hypothetical protein
MVTGATLPKRENRELRPAARATGDVALFPMTPIPYALFLLGHGGLFPLCMAALALKRAVDAATSSRRLCSTA